jgi:membrane-associated phospholipid phosphatase
LWYLVAIILISGLILASRLRLNVHKPSQVWAGFATGFLGISLFILLI